MMVTIIAVAVSIYSESKLNSHETTCKKHDYSHVKYLTSIIKLENQDKKYMNIQFLLSTRTQSLYLKKYKHLITILKDQSHKKQIHIQCVAIRPMPKMVC